MTRILAIGGAVVKTAWEELKEICEKRYIDVLIHCGGSLFHDFQRATESLEGHSYPLDLLLENYECNRPASELVWKWIETGASPEGTVTNICEQKSIDVMMFTILGADFWQLFDNRWYYFAAGSQRDFSELCKIMAKDNFHFISLGSSVVMPEIFTKVLAVAKPKHFRADVVDFIPEMYRPKTRVSKYGTYFCMTHKEFLSEWSRLGFLNGDPK